jgi:hypothetical protein
MAKHPRRQRFIVTLAIPEGATPHDVGELIADAVASWPGSLPPHDPLFDLDRDSIEVEIGRRANQRRE